MMNQCMQVVVFSCLILLGCGHNPIVKSSEVDLSGKNIKEILELYKVDKQDIHSFTGPPCVLNGYSFIANTSYGVRLFVHNEDYKLRFNESKPCSWNFSYFASLIPSDIKLLDLATNRLVDFDGKLVPIQ